MRPYSGLLILLVSVLFGAGCSSAAKYPPSAKQENTATAGKSSLPTLQEARHILVQALLEDAWIRDFAADYTRLPVVLIGAVQGSIPDSEAFTNQLSEALLGAHKVLMVSPRDGNLRPVLPEDAEAALELKKQSGADFFLQSNIVSYGKQQVLELNLVELVSFNSIWSGEKQFEQ